MQSGATVDPWAVAVFDDRCFDGQRIGQQLAECCNKRGMVISATFTYMHFGMTCRLRTLYILLDVVLAMSLCMPLALNYPHYCHLKCCFSYFESSCTMRIAIVLNCCLFLVP